MRQVCVGCLVTLAIVTSFFSIIFRPDGNEDLLAGTVWNLVITGPLWAVATFMGLRRSQNDSALRKTVAVVTSLLVYAVVASSLSALNVLKIEARKAARPRVQRFLESESRQVMRGCPYL